MFARVRLPLVSTLALAVVLASNGYAHYQMLIPNKVFVDSASPEIALDVMFAHPFAAEGMNMIMPEQFGVMVGDKKLDLLPTLKAAKLLNADAYRATYKATTPADHQFFVVPAPYWEPAEATWIQHYTKVVVSAFDAEEGWNKPVGLKAEIVPLTRPYGLYTHNIFSGVVMLNGKPAPNVPVECEFYNKDKKIEAPAPAFITQVTTTDANGVFHYAMPKAGWWGFAALMDAGDKKEREGQARPVETGAVIWVNCQDMP